MSNIAIESLNSAIETLQEKQNAPEIGTPVYNPYSHKVGYIAAIRESEIQTFTLGTGKMRPNRNQWTIVYSDESGNVITQDETPENIAESWVDVAARMNVEPCLNAPELLEIAKRQDNERHTERQRIADEINKRRAEYESEIAGKIPAWAKAVIIGQLKQDDCDTMSDYFNSRTVKTVILGFSKHTRNLFPEMRNAARNCPETADLADAPADAEHRENYSMGGGMYLKKEWRHRDGWQVSKQNLPDENKARAIPTGEWFVAEPAAPSPAQSAGTIPGSMPDGWTISKHVHTRKGFDMWICTLADRVARDVFDDLLSQARALGGWYSRPWKGTPGGFAFKSEDKAREFVGDSAPTDPDSGNSQDTSEATGSTEARESAPGPMSEAIGDKLRGLADSFETAIESKFADRLTNTPKRQREADAARNDGRNMERARDGLRALAALHDAGTVPPVLVNVRTKKAALELARSAMNHSGRYYDAGIELNKPANDTPEAIAFWDLLKQDPAKAKADELRRKIDALQFANIPGYFPTPPEVIARMIDHVGDLDGLDVIEPSAGSGAILDAISEAFPSAKLQAVERHNTLRQILEAKGYTVASDDCTDWMPDHQVDCVLMNPPFENGQDAQHVQIAHSWLRTGGRLVSIMSPGPFFRSDRKSQEFRNWFEANGGEKYDLPSGSFKASGTNVETVLVVIGKD